MTKKQDKAVEAVLTKIYDLIVDPTVKEEERKLLVNAKNSLEKKQYVPRVMNDLEVGLRPMAIRSQLSKPTGKFYLEILGQGKMEEWLGYGLAATPLMFGSIIN